MKTVSFCPFVTAYGDFSGSGKVSFITSSDSITIECDEKFIARLLRLCNGQRTIDEIRESLANIEEQVFTEAVDTLVQYGILADSRNLYQRFHELSVYPLLASYDWGPDDIREITLRPRKAIAQGNRLQLPPTIEKGCLEKLATKRHSTRAFRDETIGAERLSELLRVMYGLQGNESVPSAGQLYPLSIYLCLLRECGPLRPGCYQYDPVAHELVHIEKEASEDVVSMLLDSASILRNASAAIFIAADFQRSTMKYANRGYRYALIEAGHVVQNAYLYCAEYDLGIVEFGGFNDEEVARFFGLSFPSEGVILSCVIGMPDEEASKKFSPEFVNDEWHLRKTLVGKGKPVRWVNHRVYRIEDYTMPVYTGIARYAKHKQQPPSSVKYNNGFGMGACVAEATVKAVSEAFERYASGMVRVDARGKSYQLDGETLDLRRIAPQRLEYRKRFELSEDAMLWVQGVRYGSKKPLFVPVDQVYYPVSGKSVTYLANSTGVASRPDKNQAVQAAMLELIERDAFAVAWYARRRLPRVPEQQLPLGVLERVQALRRKNRETVFLDLTLEHVPVVACIISGNRYPCFVMGSAAGTTFTRAISKSMNEAEFMLHSWRKALRKPLPPERVRSNLDHGILFFHPTYQKQVAWLFEGSEKDVNLGTTVDVRRVLQEYDPVIVDLTPEPNPAGLSVVRVLSEKLIPLTFGYGSEHYRHPRIPLLGFEWAWSYPALPHCLA